MTRHLTTALALAAAAIFAVTAATSAVEAANKPAHQSMNGSPGSHMNKGPVRGHRPNAGMRHSRPMMGPNFSNRRADQYRNNRRRQGNFGIYLNLGNTGSCSYEYRRWQQTGTRYWRARYQDCRSG